MTIRKQPDEQAMLFFCGMANAQAAHSVLAWRWSREGFTRKLRKKVEGPPVTREDRQKCCSLDVCMQEAK